LHVPNYNTNADISGKQTEVRAAASWAEIFALNDFIHKKSNYVYTNLRKYEVILKITVFFPTSNAIPVSFIMIL
jgi:hypothetical protein